ncbi:Receptor-like protein 13 [Citrus sinensis]|nr:Receptor-like protein 13 [Citrus sinensis]
MVIMFVLLLIILEGGWSEGCLDHERFALLRLNRFFNDTGSYLYNWGDGEGATDCCQWEMVECSNTTGRVIALDLSGTYSGEYSWYLNASLFTPFQQLESLALRGNNITGFVENEGLERLSNLTLLDLSHNLFNNSILSFVARLSSLTSLDLSYNGLEGSINIKEFDSLSNLEELDMSGNEIDNFEAPQGYRGLRKLKSLHLSKAKIRDGNKLLQSMGSFPSLNTLHLSSNNFTDIATTTTQALETLSRLSNLTILDLSDNLFNNSILSFVARLSSLTSLYLSYNGLEGSINIKEFDSLSNLEELDMSGNEIDNFEVPQELHNFTNLEYLTLESSSLHISLLQSIASLFPSLKNLSMSGCEVNGVLHGQGFPHSKSLEHLEMDDARIALNTSFLQIIGESMPSLKYLSLSDYTLGTNSSRILDRDEWRISNLVVGNNTKLETLSLVNDSLGGPFRLPIHSHKRLGMLDISNNNFRGHIPVEIADVLPSLYAFNNSMNALDGSIPSSFGNMKFLQFLDLSNNHLTGEIPEHLAVGCVNLRFLALSNNNLQGHMFSRNFNLTNLKWLQLEGSRFVGEIPQSLSKCSTLEGLYLNNNSLSGKIPRWLGNLTRLQCIIMPNNHLEGPIPVEFCQLDLLQILDISDNNISGSLPSCFHPLSIKQVHLSKNMLHGQLKRGTFFNCSSLVTLDLSYNRLNGSISDWVDGLSQLSHLILGHNNLEEKQIREKFEFTTKNIAYIYQGKVLSLLSGLDLSCNKLIGPIPLQIGNLTRIQTLNLSHNNLTGSIPSTFSNLKYVESLDLSNNKLNGKIPHQLVELKTLEVFSVAYNNLSGEIPEWTAQFATFNESSYEGNTFLCGLPLPICRSPATMSEASIGNERDDNLIDMNSFFITFTTSYVIVIFATVIILYVNSYWRRRWFYFVEMWITSSYYFVVDNLIPTRFCH